MTTLYRYLFGSSTSITPSESARSVNGAKPQPLHVDTNDVEAHETTSLLKPTAPHDDMKRTAAEQSATDFYFPPSNPSIQRYYRFTSTTLTPIAALHRRPGGATPHASNPPGGVTGLLRRSAVVPSHGTDHQTGDWILVSVGGRSGWARRRTVFQPADEFRATEAWMGNHFFVCGGKCMLGSDAASFVMTNGLIATGVLGHFLLFLPRLRDLESHSVWLLDNPTALFWTSVGLTVGTMITLWWVALTDPGILPAVSSPHKPPVPTDGPLGGALGYRYCSTCNIFRPPRSKHCNACNCCVSKFDHHCTCLFQCCSCDIAVPAIHLV